MPEYVEPQTRMGKIPNYYRWIFGEIQPFVRGTVVDLGAGAGLMLPFLAQAASKIVVVERDPELLRLLGTRRASVPIEVREQNLTEEWVNLRDVRADCILALDVLAFFNDRVFISSALQLLRSQGVLILKVPADPSLFGKVDACTGNKRRYSVADLEQLGIDVGAELIHIRKFNVVGRFIYRLRRRRTSTFSQTFHPLTLSFVNIFIPLIALLDRMPFKLGLSYVAVLRRRGDLAAGHQST